MSGHVSHSMLGEQPEREADRDDQSSAHPRQRHLRGKERGQGALQRVPRPCRPALIRGLHLAGRVRDGRNHRDLPLARPAAVEPHMSPDGEPASQAVPAQLTVHPAAQGFHIGAAASPSSLARSLSAPMATARAPRAKGSSRNHRALVVYAFHADHASCLCCRPWRQRAAVSRPTTPTPASASQPRCVVAHSCGLLR
jgi:hypothetical protein